LSPSWRRVHTSKLKVRHRGGCLQIVGVKLTRLSLGSFGTDAARSGAFPGSTQPNARRGRDSFAGNGHWHRDGAVRGLARRDADAQAGGTLVSGRRVTASVPGVRAGRGSCPWHRRNTAVSRLYLGSPALDELDQAQVELDAHLPSGSDGRCLYSQQEIPCSARERASLTFRRYGALPRRRP